MDNAVARKEGHAEKLQKDSESVGDPFEISTIRREDYQFHRGDKFSLKSHCFYLPDLWFSQGRGGRRVAVQQQAVQPDGQRPPGSGRLFGADFWSRQGTNLVLCFLDFVLNQIKIQHGLDSAVPLKYSHLDIAASAGDLPKEPTGSPIVALTLHHLKGRF